MDELEVAAHTAVTLRGEAARRLLLTPDFIAILNEVGNEATLAMTKTEVGEPGRVEREASHAIIHALRTVMDTVKSYDAALRFQEAQDAVNEQPYEDTDE